MQKDEIRTIALAVVLFSFIEQTFSKLYDLYMTLNTSKQRELLERLVSYKEGEEALVDTNPTVKNVLLSFYPVRQELEQNLINGLSAGASGNAKYNFMKLFTE